MRELTMTLDGSLSIPLYEQIYEYLKQEIIRRQILLGERLPSTRALAKHLQISRSTVDLAYAQLVSEGYIEAIPCKGYFVCELDGMYEIKGITNTDNCNVQDSKTESCRYDFALNGIDEQGFPYQQWRKISKEILNSEENLFELGDSQGDYGIRNVLSNYLHHARGVNCRPEQIVVGAGNDYLLMLLRVILGDGKKIAMESPTYKSAWQGFVNLGYELCGIEMDESGICVDKLEESKSQIAYVMPSHQFPMGYVMPLKRRMQLLSWAAKEAGRYIIEDDYDSEFRYKGKPIPALQGYDRYGTVIYLGTFSKSIAPAIRISYMVLPESLLEAYKQKGHTFSATVSRVDQKIIERFIRDGYYERHLNRMRAIYKNKHDIVLSVLRDMTEICSVSGENAGVHVVLSFTNGLTEKEAIDRALKEGIRVYGLSAYKTSETFQLSSESVLLGYATMSEKQIVEAMGILKRIWKK